jgi:hypothetical protein
MACSRLVKPHRTGKCDYNTAASQNSQGLSRKCDSIPIISRSKHHHLTFLLGAAPSGLNLGKSAMNERFNHSED